MQPVAPFYRHGAENLAEAAVNAVVALHERGGAEQVTLSAIAEMLGCARSTVHAAHGGVAGLYVSLAVRFGRRWDQWVTESRLSPIPVRLPESDFERLAVLTWSSLRQIAGAEARAGRPEAWNAVASVLAAEQASVAWVVERSRVESGPAPSPVVSAEAVMAFIDGLRWRVSQPTGGGSFEEAVELLRCTWTGPFGLACDDRGDAWSNERSFESLDR